MFFSIVNIVNWEFIGYNMIIMYAALRSIPTELYEAARVDGAGGDPDRLVDQDPGHPTRAACSR